MLRKEEGITLVALVITIIVLIILAGVIVPGAMRGIDDAQEDKLWSEIDMVQHAILERSTKYKLTKNTEILDGNIIDTTTLEDAPTFKISQDSINSMEDASERAFKSYYKLEANDLDNLGLNPGADSFTNTYIVNYSTGEVYNSTRKKAPSGTVLYITLQLNKE